MDKLRTIGKLATPSTAGAAGYDLQCQHEVILYPHESAIVSTGVELEIPKGYCALIIGRSGLAFKLDVVAFNGLIDSDYRGEVKVKLFNLGTEYRYFEKGTRIAQLLFLPYKVFELEYPEALNPTERGASGFGSTGA